MKIRFISHAKEELASHRMRVLKPVELLKARGHDASWGDEVEVDADVTVFQKHLDSMYDSQMLGILKFYGKKTVFDFSDSHLDNPKLKDHYVTMAQQADVVTCNGPTLQKKIKDATAVEALLVKDPITFPEYPVRLNLDNPKLLWFGHSSNLGPLVNILPELKEYQITIITNQPLIIGNSHPNVRALQWEIGLVETEIQSHDIVILPMKEDPNKQYKNTNRAVDTLMAGKLVVTDSEQIYGELKNFIVIADTIKKGLDRVVSIEHSTDYYNQMVLAGQDYVRHTYSDIVVGDMWEQALVGEVTRKKTEFCG